METVESTISKARAAPYLYKLLDNLAHRCKLGQMYLIRANWYSYLRIGLVAAMLLVFGAATTSTGNAQAGDGAWTSNDCTFYGSNSRNSIPEGWLGSARTYTSDTSCTSVRTCISPCSGWNSDYSAPLRADKYGTANVDYSSSIHGAASSCCYSDDHYIHQFP